MNVTETSSENLQMRLPWGVNEPKLTNYVLETMAKMYKMRKNEKKE
jgi:3-methyladenine DNA glycosylase AlkC